MKIIQGWRDFSRLEDEVDTYIVRAFEEKDYSKKNFYYTLAKRLVSVYQSKHPCYIRKSNKLLDFIHCIEDQEMSRNRIR